MKPVSGHGVVGGRWTCYASPSSMPSLQTFTLNRRDRRKDDSACLPHATCLLPLYLPIWAIPKFQVMEAWEISDAGSGGWEVECLPTQGTQACISPNNLLLGRHGQWWAGVVVTFQACWAGAGREGPGANHASLLPYLCYCPDTSLQFSIPCIVFSSCHFCWRTGDIPAISSLLIPTTPDLQEEQEFGRRTCHHANLVPRGGDVLNSQPAGLGNDLNLPMLCYYPWDFLPNYSLSSGAEEPLPMETGRELGGKRQTGLEVFVETCHVCCCWRGLGGMILPQHPKHLPTCLPTPTCHELWEEDEL